MGRQFPPAGGTGAIVRSGQRVRRSAPANFGAPLPSYLGVRRVRNRQFGTTVRRDAPRGNAPPRLNTWRKKRCRNLRTQLASLSTVMPGLVPGMTPWRQGKGWMAGTSPAMTNGAFWRNEPEVFGSRTVFWRNEPESSSEWHFGETNPRRLVYLDAIRRGAAARRGRQFERRAKWRKTGPGTVTRTA